MITSSEPAITVVRQTQQLKHAGNCGWFETNRGKSNGSVLKTTGVDVLL